MVLPPFFGLPGDITAASWSCEEELLPTPTLVSPEQGLLLLIVGAGEKGKARPECWRISLVLLGDDVWNVEGGW